jgi:putative methionine-R-sulfoxide reductase with GAF domain
MAVVKKKIAIIGANKEGLKLLPVILADERSQVCLIVDPNREAMLFKLKELGYRLVPGLDIETSYTLDDLKRIDGLSVIVDALQDQKTEKFLESPEFRDVEKLGPLSTRLIWGVRTATSSGGVLASEGVQRATEQASLLSALREIVDAIRLTIDRKELLSVILKLATESTVAERGSIMLLSPGEGTLRVEIAKGMDEEVVRKVRVPLGDGVSGKVAKYGKPLMVSGKADSEKFDRPMDRTDVKSAMCVPLIVDGEIIGVINVNSSESTHVFTNDDLNFLTSLAGLAAEVIQRSNEYEKLRVDAAKFTFWKEVDTIMSTNIPLEKRLNTVSRRLSELVPGLTCFIYLYDDETDRLYLKASSIKDAKGLGLFSLRAGEALEGEGMASREDIFLVDRTEAGALKRVYVTLPMVSHGMVVGVFNGHIVSPHGISVYHESFLKGCAQRGCSRSTRPGSR